jgi:hypothetical protein
LKNRPRKRNTLGGKYLREIFVPSVNELMIASDTMKTNIPKNEEDDPKQAELEKTNLKSFKATIAFLHKQK